MRNTEFVDPADVRDSVESLYQLHGPNRASIYWLLLVTLIVGLGALPLLKINVSVGAPGQIRPETERTPVFASTSGVLSEVSVRENQLVEAGQTLIRFQSAGLDAQLEHNKTRRLENDAASADLGTLTELAGHFHQVNTSPSVERSQLQKFINEGSMRLRKLRTANYARQLGLMLAELERYMLVLDKRIHEQQRLSTLHKRGLISDGEHEDSVHETLSSAREARLAVDQYLVRWQAEKIDREMQGVQLKAEAEQLRHQSGLYELKSPARGITLGFTGLAPGMFVTVGQRLGEVSPGENLQAEIFIDPKDIAFVQVGQAVSVQVAAFPYVEWGALSGKVREVSADVLQTNQSIAYRAIVDLQTTRLENANGASGEVKRGMTVQARFLIKERSLASLLFGKLSDSLDPASPAAP